MRNAAAFAHELPSATHVRAGHEPASVLSKYFEASLYLLLYTSVLTLVSTGKLDIFTTVAAPAVLNAIAAATGKRVRSVPLKNTDLRSA